MYSTTVEVNGPESDALPVTVHALRSDISYNDDELLVPVTALNPSLVNGESVQTLPRSEFSHNDNEPPVPDLNPNLVHCESVQTPPRSDFSYNDDEPPVPVLNSGLVNGESVQTPHRSDISHYDYAPPVPVIDPNLINGESVQTPLSSDFSYIDDEPRVPATVLNPSNGESVQTPPRSDFSHNDDETPVTVINATLPHGESVQTPPSFTIDDSIITAKCSSPKESVPIEGSDRSTSPQSPRLSPSMTVAKSDYPQSPENKSLPGSCPRSSPKSYQVTSESGNVGRSRLERLTQNGVRRSPRLSSSPSCPQTEGPKLKRIKSCVEDVKVQRGNGSCEQIAPTASSNKKQSKRRRVSNFVGEPVPENEAQERWGWRYELKGQIREGQSWILNAGKEDEVHLNVECHYLQANIDGCIFSLGDCAHIKGEGKQPHVGRIVEFFKTSDDGNYFRVQWFFRAVDTVIKEAATFHDNKRLFASTLMNDNLLDCILSKVNILEKPPVLGFRSSSFQRYDYYCDMEYSDKYSTFRSLVTATDSLVARSDLAAPSSLDTNNMTITTTPLDISGCEIYKSELALLDLYSGCGGMSTGLCLGAKLSGIKLVTRWAIDYHKSACDSLKLNHPETEVRHTTAEDFLELLKEWQKLCKIYLLDDCDKMIETNFGGENESRIDESSVSDTDMAPGEYEVSSLVDICYGDPSSTGQHGLKFKVRWKGYGPSDDTWEPIETLSDCQGHIQSFVRGGYKSKILPCPGDVDVICGGPPCQGISGYNRFRNTNDPLNDERNQQIVVFFDIVKFLNPKYVLMENVADILRFDKASLGRYALSRLVHMNYQARLGIMAAGSYGLPQFRLRVFLWGAHPNERLPQFPLPTHEVIVRYFPPAEFEQNTVAYDEGQPRKLQEAIVLRDAISDLPAVTSHETREEMAYDMPPETEFQKYIRLTKDEFTGSTRKGVTDWKSSFLTDHRPYKISEDDFHRVCRVPRKKGANFRDFPGVIVRADNTVRRDPKKEELLPSGRPLIPDYALTFEKGKSKRPFGRVWWDENVATVVTFPNLHCQAAIHPEQDRVLTLREYARLQGFPDHYRFCGNIKERYCQVGNAVAVSVSKTLGYALGMAFQKLSGDEALMTLPPGFSFQVPSPDDFPSQL